MTLGSWVSPPHYLRPHARGQILRPDSSRSDLDWPVEYGLKGGQRYTTSSRLELLSEDPIGFAAGDTNVARYVGNGVTGATDPSGLEERGWGGWAYDSTFGWVVPRSFWSYGDTVREQGRASREGRLELMRRIDRGEDIPVDPGRMTINLQPETTELLEDGARFAINHMAAGPIVIGAVRVRTILDGIPGKIGKSGPIKEVPNVKTLDDLFDSLGKGGKTINPGTYPGVVKQLPDGTIIRRRPGSKSGGATLDITVPDGTITKVHINPKVRNN